MAAHAHLKNEFTELAQILIIFKVSFDNIHFLFTNISVVHTLKDFYAPPTKPAQNKRQAACRASTVMFLSFRTDRSGQTEQIQIRLLLEEKSHQGLHCLQCPLHLLDALLLRKRHLVQVLEEQSDQGVLFAMPFAAFGCITLKETPSCSTFRVITANFRIFKVLRTTLRRSHCITFY